MQFKIAVVGNQMFGDISLIAPNRNQPKPIDPNDKFSGFTDDKLKNLLETGAGDRKLDQPLTIKSSTGGNEIKINTLRELAI